MTVDVEVKRERSTEARQASADRGHAMPDGSFPIEDAHDLENAIQAFGRAKNKPAVRRHIRRRARALGLTDKLPESWSSTSSSSKDAARKCKFCDSDAKVAVDPKAEGKDRVLTCVKHTGMGRRVAGAGATVTKLGKTDDAKRLVEWDPVKHPRQVHGWFGPATGVVHPPGTRIVNPDGSITTHMTHTTVTFVPYEGGPPDTIREMIKESGGLKAMIREDLATLAREIAMLVTGSGHGAKAFGAPDLEELIIGKLEALAAHDADLLDPDVFDMLINELREEYGDQPGTAESKSVKGKYEEAKHPRDKNGRFTFIGAAVSDAHGGGHIVKQSGGKVTVQNATGQKHTVAASEVEVAKGGHKHEGQNLSTPEGLHAHLSGHHEGGHAVAPFPLEEHAAHAHMHERAHAMGADGHSHGPDGTVIPQEPKGGKAGHDLSTPEGLDAHLDTHPGGRAGLPKVTADNHAAMTRLHEHAHKVGVDGDHSHLGMGPSDDERIAAANARLAAARKPGVDKVKGADEQAVIARGDHRDHPMPMVPGATDAKGNQLGEGDPRNDPEYHAYTDEVDKLLAKYEHSDKFNTYLANTTPVLNPDGSPKLDDKGEPVRRWTAERDDMHQAIIDQIMADSASVPSDGQAVMLGGLPGAGKSTFLKMHGDKLGLTLDEHDDPTNAIVINPDNMKTLLLSAKTPNGDPMVPLAPGLKPGEHASLMHEESSHLAALLAKRAMAEHRNVVFDITLGNAEKATAKYLTNKHGTGAKDLGYTVRAAFVDGDMATSLHRAGLRHKAIDKETGARTFGGRYVNYGHILSEGARANDPLTSDGQRPMSHNRVEYDKLVKQGLFDHAIRFDNKTGSFTTDVVQD